MKKVHLDFESRSLVDIWEVGAWIYSTHPSTRIHCAAHALGDEEVGITTRQDLDWRRLDLLAAWAEDPEIIFYAHNAFFERCMWANIMVKQFGMPPIPLKRWRCTMAKACAYSLPKALDKASMAMGLTQNKDKVGRQIMLRMAKPLKKGTDIYDEDPEHYKILYDYCRQDVRVERELDNALPDLSDIEQEIWFYDQLINSRGIHVDMSTVRNFIKILEHKTNALNAELRKLTGGVITKGTQTKSMLAYLNKQGAQMPCFDKYAVRDAIASGRLKKEHIQILRLRQQLGKSSLAKYTTLTNAVDQENVLRDNFIYHAASTGRWGGKLVQLQNLPKNTAKIDTDKAIDDINTVGYPTVEMLYPGKIMDVLSSCIRGVLVPAPGKEFYVVDYGAIEARIVMWLAGETKGLAEFKATDTGVGEDIYVKMAQRIYADPRLTKAKNPGERQLGKQAILGCGFGMGAAKFKGTCAKYDIDIEEHEAKRVVDLYRSTYYNVRNYWYDMENCMMRAFENPGTITTIGQVQWIYRPERKAMFCKLPSGRILTYIGPRLEENRFGNMGMTFMTEVNSQWVRRDTYGGLLVENITQATARDIMAYAMPTLEHQGFPVLMHTHDEIVSERPIGEDRLDEMVNIMCVRPQWAFDCPIVAEGFTAQRYKKE